MPSHLLTVRTGPIDYQYYPFSTLLVREKAERTKERAMDTANRNEHVARNLEEKPSWFAEATSNSTWENIQRWTT
jgi:hypothetical protein